MDKAGVATAMLSVMQPGVWFGDDEQGRSLARRCNDYAAQLVKDHPGKFGMFATIPLPDTEGSLKEIEYGLDVLKAGGIALMTSYYDKYLGDPAFLPVFEELNRRKAVVYVHPNTPDCCKALVKGMPVGTIEYATDTTRTISSLIFGEAGTAFKCPDIRFIWSHSGGTLPFLTGRLIRLARDRKDARMPDGPIPILKRYNYEIAQGNTAGPTRGADEARAGLAGDVRLGLSLRRRHRGRRGPHRLPLQRGRPARDRARECAEAAAGGEGGVRLPDARHSGAAAGRTRNPASALHQFACHRPA